MQFQHTDSKSNASWSFDPARGKWTAQVGDFRRTSATLETVVDAVRKHQELKAGLSNTRANSDRSGGVQEVEAGLIEINFDVIDWMNFRGRATDLFVGAAVRTKLGWNAKEGKPEIVRLKNEGSGGWHGPHGPRALLHPRALGVTDLNMMANAIVAATLAQKLRVFEEKVRQAWYARQIFHSQAVVGWEHADGSFELITSEEAHKRQSGRAAIMDSMVGRCGFTAVLPTTVPVIVVDAAAADDGWARTSESTWSKGSVSLALVVGDKGMAPFFEVRWNQSDTGPSVVFRGDFRHAKVLAEATVVVAANLTRPVRHWSANVDSSSKVLTQSWPVLREDWASVVVFNHPGRMEEHFLGSCPESTLGSQLWADEQSLQWRKPHRRLMFRPVGDADSAMQVVKEMKENLQATLSLLPTPTQVKDFFKERSEWCVQNAYAAAGDGEPWDPSPEAASAVWEQKRVQIKSLVANSPLVERFEADLEKAWVRAQSAVMGAAPAAPATAPGAPEAYLPPAPAAPPVGRRPNR